MGPLSYMRSVGERNVVMRHMIVQGYQCHSLSYSLSSCHMFGTESADGHSAPVNEPPASRAVSSLQ